jgi:hypothetical protein
MIGSYSFNPQLNPPKLLHFWVHPHGGRSAQRSESRRLKTHRTGASPRADGNRCLGLA